MAKRRIKLNEEDLKAFLSDALRSSGYMTDDAEIVGFEYKTRTIRKGGDYYKDGVDDKDYPGEVEVVKFIKVLTDTGRQRKGEHDVQSETDDGGESAEDDH